MKKDQLVKLIRGIVREEVTRVVSDVVPTILAEVVAEHVVDSQPQPQPQVVTEAALPSLAEMIGIPKAQPSEVKYTDNPILNSILQQTQPLSHSEASNGMLSPAQMMAQQYENQQMERMMNEDIGPMEDYTPRNMKSLDGFDNKINSVVPQQPQPQAAPPAQAAPGVPLTEQPVELDMRSIAALTKNASAAFKKSKEISKQNQPSNINFEAPQVAHG